jgi:hypothetical protein
MIPHSTGSGIRGWCRNCAGAYIVELVGHPVLNTSDFETSCASVRVALIMHPKTVITLIIAPEWKEPLWDPGCAPRLHIYQLRPVIQTLFEIREGRYLTEAKMPDDDELVAAIHSVAVSDDINVKDRPGPDLGVHHIMECKMGTHPGSNLTRRQLRKLLYWHRWKKAETTQLTSMKANGMYNPPCVASHWRYRIAHHLDLLCEVGRYSEVPHWL